MDRLNIFRISTYQTTKKHWKRTFFRRKMWKVVIGPYLITNFQIPYRQNVNHWSLLSCVGFSWKNDNNNNNSISWHKCWCLVRMHWLYHVKSFTRYWCMDAMCICLCYQCDTLVNCCCYCLFHPMPIAKRCSHIRYYLCDFFYNHHCMTIYIPFSILFRKIDRNELPLFSA